MGHNSIKRELVVAFRAMLEDEKEEFMKELNAAEVNEGKQEENGKEGKKVSLKLNLLFTQKLLVDCFSCNTTYCGCRKSTSCCDKDGKVFDCNARMPQKWCQVQNLLRKHW